MGIIVVFGICLFIIPGIYLALRLQFFTAFIVEEDTGIIESLKRSWGNNPRTGHAVIYAYAGHDRNFFILGLILLGIGIFVAMPLIYMMYGYVFVN